MTPVFFIVIVSILGTILFLFMMAILVMLFTVIKNDKNPIDIYLFEMTKGFPRIKRKRGRFIMDPHLGRVLVTVGNFPNSIDQKLTYHVSDNDLIPIQKMLLGLKPRKAVLLATKDNISTPLDLINKQKNTLTDKEKEVLKSVAKRFHTVISMEEIPEHLSLKPIKYEQTRMILDIHKDTADVYGDKEKELGRTLIKAGIALIMFVMVMAFVVIVILVTQGPDLAIKTGEVVASGIPPG